MLWSDSKSFEIILDGIRDLMMRQMAGDGNAVEYAARVWPALSTLWGKVSDCA